MTANCNAAIRTIVVVGGGVVARSAALSFARALPGVEITLVPAPVSAGALADWFPVLLGSERGAFGRWGVEEADLLRSGCALPRLGASFDGWGSAAPWLWAEGDLAPLPGRGALHQRWLRATRANAVPPFHDLLPAAAMAQAGTFAADPAPPLDAANHGVRFDARLLAEALTPCLVRAGARQAAPFAGVVRREDGALGAVRLQSGESLAADLFVDASGPPALLRGPTVRSLDWTDTLPADRLLVATGLPSSASIDRYRRWSMGWAADWPGRRRSFRAIAFSAALCDEAAARTMLDDAGAPAALAEMPAGRQQCFWSDNCLAIGEAAAQFGALEFVGFSFAQAQIGMALELLPPRSMPERLLLEYDRLAGMRADTLRDWLAAHHLPPAASTAGAFWAEYRLPPSLAATVEQFTQRGTLPYRDEESVEPAAWHAVLIGQGIRPRRDDPLAMTGDASSLARDLALQARTLAEAAAGIQLRGIPSGISA